MSRPQSCSVIATTLRVDTPFRYISAIASFKATFASDPAFEALGVELERVPSRHPPDLRNLKIEQTSATRKPLRLKAVGVSEALRRPLSGLRPKSGRALDLHCFVEHGRHGVRHAFESVLNQHVQNFVHRGTLVFVVGHVRSSSLKC